MKFQTPRGTRDFMPKDMIKRQFVLDNIRRVFERWGFDPLETPAFEDWKLLEAKGGGGEEIKKELYFFKDKSDRELGLRFDLTTPLARVIANNPQLSKPFKRYQIGPVWRYDRPGAGRWREFWQADVDVVGSSESISDAEVIAVACDVLIQLGFKDFLVRINSRKLIEELLIEIGIKKEKMLDVFRSVDKLEKIGASGVKEELHEKGFSQSQITKILEIVESEINEVKTSSIEARRALDELNEIIKIVCNFGYKNKILVDLSLIRGLDYYTGPVFEISIGSNNLSVSGGGRYENLVQILGGKPTPATGLSLGVERIVEIMDESKMFSDKNTVTQIFLICVCEEAMDEIIKISNKLRNAGVSCDFDLMKRSMQKQLSYANSKGIPFVVIIGKKELEEKTFKIKDMKTGKEHPIKINNIESLLKIVNDF